MILAFPIYSRYWLPQLIGYLPNNIESRNKSFIKDTHPNEYKFIRPEEISYNNNLFALHMRTIKNFYQIIGNVGTGKLQIEFLENYFKLHNIHRYKASDY